VPACGHALAFSFLEHRENTDVTSFDLVRKDLRSINPDLMPCLRDIGVVRRN
jgi:hypothetical protein